MTTQRIYEARFKKAVEHFRGVPAATKESAGTALSRSVRDAAVAGVNVILGGLAEDLRTLLASGGDSVQEKVDEVFDLASAATRKLLSVADIKAGKAHWMSKAHLGVEDPPKPETKTWVAEALTPGSK